MVFAFACLTLAIGCFAAAHHMQTSVAPPRNLRPAPYTDGRPRRLGGSPRFIDRSRC